MTFPPPDRLHPVNLADGGAHPGTVFLQAAIRHPRWTIGRYSYASADQPPGDWAAHLAPHLCDFSPERLEIGAFCQIADGVRLITASANHRMDGFSTFPFAIFEGMAADRPSRPMRWSRAIRAGWCGGDSTTPRSRSRPCRRSPGGPGPSTASLRMRPRSAGPTSTPAGGRTLGVRS